MRVSHMTFRWSEGEHQLARIVASTKSDHSTIAATLSSTETLMVSPEIGFPLGKDRFDSPAHSLRRTEKIGQLANEIDAEIRGNAPPRLFAVEKPRRVLGAAVRENGVRRTDAPDRSLRKQLFRGFDRRASVERQRHEYFARPLGRPKDAARVDERSRDGLFAQHVLAPLEAAD